MPVPLVIGAALIGGGAAIASSAVSSHAARQVAGMAQQTAATNNATQADIYGSNKAELDPYVQRGNTAGDYLQALLGLDGTPEAHARADAAFQQYLGSTGYQFALNQGTRAATSGAAGRGAVQSGATMRALAEYGQGLASQRFGQFTNEVRGQQTTGLNAASSLAGAGQHYADATSANNNAAMETGANATLTSAGNTAGAIGSLANIAAGALGQSSYKPTSVSQAGVSKPSVAASPIYGSGGAYGI